MDTDMQRARHWLRQERLWRKVWPASAATALILGACGTTAGVGGLPLEQVDAVATGDLTGADPGSGPDLGSTKDVAPGGPIINLVVDANRDGVVKPGDPADEDFGNVWDDKHGASFLANLDDDDGDKREDALDEIVNGEADALDLARMRLVAWPAAPDGAVGHIAIDQLGAENIRLWKHKADGSWEAIAGTSGTCPGSDCTTLQAALLTVDDLRSGAELGIEGRDFVRSVDEAAWNGYVDFSLAVVDKDGNLINSPGSDDGLKRIRMKVAPWILNGNTSAFDEVRSDKTYKDFVADMAVAVPAANVKYTTYSNWNDQWTQDFYQTAWTSIPAAGGKVQGMRVLNARPWGRQNGTKYLPIQWLRDNYLGSDKAIITLYRKPNTGSSYDSHGNHDLLPPYSKDKETYPLGRILTGSGALPETMAFYAAQKVQGPAVVVDTTWLLVGHCDEVLSYAPAATPRGWKLLVASDLLGIEMLEDQQKAGQGSVQMFTGLKNYDAKTGALKTATVTIDQALADVDLMQWSQEAEVKTLGVLETTQIAAGLADDEIVEIPIITEEVDGGKIAWLPGMVNSLVVGDHFITPNPFGPIINGADIYAKYLLDHLGSALHKLGKDGKGMQVHLINDWSGYHVAEGEVHCASNPEGPPNPDMHWWEVVR